MPTSQNGYPASANRASIGVKTYQVPGRPDVKVPLRGDIAPLILEFVRWWNAAIEPLMVPGCWGYAYRDIRGSTGLSNHASGTAGDANAPKHPLGKVGTVPNGVRAAISTKARSRLEVGLALIPPTRTRLLRMTRADSADEHILWMLFLQVRDTSRKVSNSGTCRRQHLRPAVRALAIGHASGHAPM